MSMYSRVRPSGCVEAHAVPALGDLRAGDAEPEAEAAAGERVDRCRGHRSHRRRAAGDLEDRGADVDALGLGRDPGEHGRCVRAVGLSRPHDGIAERVGLLGELEILGVVARAPVAHVESELHRIALRHHRSGSACQCLSDATGGHITARPSLVGCRRAGSGQAASP